MDVSLGLYPDAPAPALVATACLAEELGYASLWLADSHLLWREPYVLLGAVAQCTHRIRLATCVTNPLTRHPSVTAAAFASLAELVGARTMLGISVGDSALKTLGKEPATRSQLTACVHQLRTLLAGEAVTIDGEHAAKLAYAGGDRVPIYIAASGPRMLRLAGALADGVVLMNGVAPELLSAACALVDAGAREAGRDPSAVRRVAWAACHVSDQDPEGSIAACKYNVARTILRNLPGDVDARARDVAAQVRARYDYAQHGRANADFARLIPDDIVQRFAFAGTTASLRAAIEAAAEAGVDEVALAIPDGAANAGRDDVLRRVGDTVPDRLANDTGASRGTAHTPRGCAPSQRSPQ